MAMSGFYDICRAHSFKIPANQRGYSWEEDQINSIFHDLALAGSSAHYMGAIIVSRTSTPDFHDERMTVTAEYLIDDGQQRITTMFLICNQIMNRIKILDEGITLDVQELDNLLCYNKGGKHCRIQNSNANFNSFFRYIMNLDPVRPSDVTRPMARLENADQYIKKRIDQMDRGELTIWKNRLLNNAKFIWVDLQSEGVNPYLTFDAINSRGLPLGEFDKIKNFCILVDSIRNLSLNSEVKWYNALLALENYDVSSRQFEAAYICELYSVFHDEVVSQGDVHTEFVKKYRKLLDASDTAIENDLKQFIELWEPYAKSFGFIATESKNRPSSLATTEGLEWLTRIENMDLTGITRSILVASHYRMNKTEFERMARVCEIFTFRVFAVMKYRKDKYGPNLNTLAHRILRTSHSFINSVHKLCSFIQISAPMDKFINELSDGKPKYNFDPSVKGWPHCYYFLYEYEVGNSSAGVAPLAWQTSKEKKISTQEHILPRTHRDGGWWEAHWPDASSAEGYKHRLGNLVLTNNNSALGRKEIQHKITDPGGGYSYTSPTATNTEKNIVNYTNGVEWLSKNILLRELDMLKFATKRWSIPCPGDNTSVLLSGDYLTLSGLESRIDVENEIPDYLIPAEPEITDPGGEEPID